MLRFLIVALFAVLPLAAHAETAYERVMKSGTLRCGYALSPPTLSKDVNTGALSGWNYDVVEAIGHELGLKTEWTEEAGWGNFIEGLDAGRYDAFCSVLWPDAGRMRRTSLAGPVSYDFAYTYVRTDDHRFDSGLEALNRPEVSIPVIEGDVTVSLAGNWLPKARQIALPQNSTLSDLILSVTTGKADVLVLTPDMFAAYDRENPGILRKLENVPPSAVYGTYLAVRSGEIQLRDMLQAALRNMIDDGRLKRIIGQHNATQILPEAGYQVRSPNP